MPNYWPPDIPREDISRSDKVEAIRNDQRLRNATTYHQQSRLTDPDGEVGGRFAQPEVSGEGDHVLYPTLPDTSPWSTPNMPEPPLGYSVDSIEPLGEPHEIAHAAAILAARETPSTPDRAMTRKAGGEGEGGFAPSSVPPSQPIPADGRACPPSATATGSGCASPAVEPVATPIVHRRKIV